MLSTLAAPALSHSHFVLFGHCAGSETAIARLRGVHVRASRLCNRFRHPAAKGCSPLQGAVWGGIPSPPDAAPLRCTQPLVTRIRRGSRGMAVRCGLHAVFCRVYLWPRSDKRRGKLASGDVEAVECGPAEGGPGL